VLEQYTYALIISVLTINAIIAIYGIVYRRSLIKKLIALTILGDTVFIAVIFSGFYFTHPIVPPVYPEPSDVYVDVLAKHASDPLPQALVLTGIVIGLAVNALIAFGIIQLYRLKGTTDAKKLVETLVEAGVAE